MTYDDRDIIDLGGHAEAPPLDDWVPPGVPSGGNIDTQARRDALRARIVPASKRLTEDAAPYLVKRVLNQGAVACVHGPTGTAKTQVMLHFGVSVLSRQDWFGCRVTERDGFIAMLAAEDQFGISPRVHAELQRVRETLDDETADRVDSRYILLRDPGLWSKGVRGDKAVAEVIEMLDIAAADLGVPCLALQIDTAPKILAGQSVNDDDVVTCFIDRCERIGRATGAATISSAHPGHNNQERVAGSAQSENSYYSSIRITIDMADQKPQNSDVRTIHIDKAKGYPAGYMLGQYDLGVETVGTDQDGDDITGLLLNPKDQIVETRKKDKPKALPYWARRAEECLLELYTQGRHYTVTGAEIGIRDAPNELWQVVNLHEWKDYCRECLLSEKKLEGGPDAISKRESKDFQKALNWLETRVRGNTAGEHAWHVNPNQDRKKIKQKAKPSPRAYKKTGSRGDGEDHSPHSARSSDLPLANEGERDEQVDSSFASFVRSPQPLGVANVENDERMKTSSKKRRSKRGAK